MADELNPSNFLELSEELIRAYIKSGPSYHHLNVQHPEILQALQARIDLPPMLSKLRKKLLCRFCEEQPVVESELCQQHALCLNCASYVDCYICRPP